jgi:hypothetical protein
MGDSGTRRDTRPTSGRFVAIGHPQARGGRRYVGDRTLAWADDELYDDAESWAQVRSAPTLLVRTRAVDRSHARRERLVEFLRREICCGVYAQLVDPEKAVVLRVWAERFRRRREGSR